MQNTQAAWIKRVDADDSIAVLFDYSTSGGVDIAKKISSGRVYLFTIEPIDEVPFHTASDRIGKFDSSIARIESLQTRALLDSPLVVKSDIFWRVLSIDKP
jgi:esterase/lipase superfamily enzyme